jgi:hypothetical protein
LRRAQARLQEAEEKLLAVRRWGMVLEREVEDYQGPSQQLSNLLEADLTMAVAHLDQLITSLEAYLSLAAPATAAAPAATPISRGGNELSASQISNLKSKKDQVRTDFERQYLEALAPRVLSLIERINCLSQLIVKARNECADPRD